MKRFFAIFICIATALIFVACTNNSETKAVKPKLRKYPHRTAVVKKVLRA